MGQGTQTEKLPALRHFGSAHEEGHRLILVRGPSDPLGAFTYDRMINEEELTANSYPDFTS